MGLDYARSKTNVGSANVWIFAPFNSAWRIFWGLYPWQFRVGQKRECYSIEGSTGEEATQVAEVDGRDVGPPFVAGGFPWNCVGDDAAGWGFWTMVFTLVSCLRFSKLDSCESTRFLMGLQSWRRMGATHEFGMCPGLFGCSPGYCLEDDGGSRVGACLQNGRSWSGISQGYQVVDCRTMHRKSSLCSAIVGRPESSSSAPSKNLAQKESLEITFCFQMETPCSLYGRGMQSRGECSPSSSQASRQLGASHFNLYGFSNRLGGNWKRPKFGLQHFAPVQASACYSNVHRVVASLQVRPFSSQSSGWAIKGPSNFSGRWYGSSSSGSFLVGPRCAARKFEKGTKGSKAEGRRRSSFWWIGLLVLICSFRGSLAPGSREPLAKKGARAWDNVAEGKPVSRQGVNRLLLHKVDDGTNWRYIKAVKCFFQHLRSSGTSEVNADDIDWSAADYMANLVYVQQKGIWMGSALVSGLMHLSPWLKGRLPMATKALAAWGKLALGGEGSPIARETLAVVILKMIELGYIEEAVIVWVSYDAYLREQDWQNLLPQDISISGRVVALLFGVRSRGSASKTGSNQGVILEDTYLSQIFRVIKLRAESGQPVFRVSVDVFRRRWWTVLKMLGLEWIGVPHNIRHSRPTRELMLGTKSLEMVRRRGRWKALSSVERYTRAHWLIQHESKVPTKFWKMGSAFWEDPKALSTEYLSQSEGRSSVWAAILAEALAMEDVDHGYESDTTMHTSKNLKALKKPELQRLARLHKLDESGTKKILLERLTDHERARRNVFS